MQRILAKPMLRLYFNFISGIVLIIPAILYAGERGSDYQNFEFLDASINHIQLKLEAGEITSRELVETYLERIKAYDQKGPSLNAISVLNPKAIERAIQLDHFRFASSALKSERVNGLNKAHEDCCMASQYL